MCYDAYESQNTGLAYYEVENGFAIKKWHREYEDPKTVAGNHPLLNYLGESAKMNIDEGSFPLNISNQYVAFLNVHWLGDVVTKELVMELYTPDSIVTIINEEGLSYIPDDGQASFVFSNELYKEMFYLAKFDESQYLKKSLK